MDKLVIGLFADILYHKGVINADEFEGLLELKTPCDVDTYMARMYRGDFSAYKRGEHYTSHAN